MEGGRERGREGGRVTTKNNCSVPLSSIIKWLVIILYIHIYE